MNSTFSETLIKKAIARKLAVLDILTGMKPLDYEAILFNDETKPLKTVSEQ